MSMNTIVTPRCGVVYGSNGEGKRNLSEARDINGAWWAGRPCLYFLGGRMASFAGSCDMSRSKSTRIRAGWLFKGHDKGSESDASCEHSESANEDILMFFFELDLAIRLQYALNLEQYDIAQQLRNKLTEVESEVINSEKTGGVSHQKVKLKTWLSAFYVYDLQNAIQNEKYNLAAELRDEISKLEAKSLDASVISLAYENAQYTYRLGQRVKHKKFGYQAVICGWILCAVNRSHGWMMQMLTSLIVAQINPSIRC